MNAPITYRLTKEGVLTIQIDASHDPWSILATRIIEFLVADLDEMGIQVQNIEAILKRLSENHGTIQ
jgi:hypothetical protein